MPNFADDKSILDTALLLRRIHPDHYVPVGQSGQRRISSAAFNDPELSVFLRDLVVASGREPRDVLIAYPKYGLASITAGQARACQPAQGVCLEKDDDPAHGLVFGKKAKSVKNTLKAIATVIVAPPL